MSDEPEPQQSDEELAAAWGAETESAEAVEAQSGQPARVLNQAEIDSLLGFGDDAAGGPEQSGMQRIISSGLVSYEALVGFRGGGEPLIFNVLSRKATAIAHCRC